LTKLNYAASTKWHIIFGVIFLRQIRAYVVRQFKLSKLKPMLSMKYYVSSSPGTSLSIKQRIPISRNSSFLSRWMENWHLLHPEKWLLDKQTRTFIPSYVTYNKSFSTLKKSFVCYISWHDRYHLPLGWQIIQTSWSSSRLQVGQRL